MDATAPRIGVDVGGTFTDVALLVGGGDRDGDSGPRGTFDLVTAKVPTTADQSVGVMRGIEKACASAGIDPDDLAEFIHATTVSVNALLEGTGAETALVTTAGFRDVLEIGRQDRPSLYDLDAEKPEPLVPRRRRYELDERATVEGIETPVDEAEVRALAERLCAADVESVAVSLLHAYANPGNERLATEVLREELDAPVSASHEVLAAFREYERTSTTVVEAAVTPVIDAYVARLAERAADAGVPRPRIMQSNGGIADADTARENAVTTVLSGPAAGVIGAVATATTVAEERGLDGLVTFDMGGTSSDVSLVRDGEVARTTDAEIDGHPIGVPMVDVTTVGSGGGSIAWVDAGGALRVGPRSAGADPGPACYGAGGTEPTVTDANVVLGYVGESTALGGELSLDVAAGEAALERLADEAGLDGARAAAEGVYRVANAKMTRAIRSVTVERGHDPRGFGLVGFGGAGPMHATGLADRLEMDTVVVPLASGVLSAYGLLDADEQYDAVRTHRTRLADADVDAVGSAYDDLAGEALADVRDREAAVVRLSADVRYAGQSFELTVDVGEWVDEGGGGAFDPDGSTRAVGSFDPDDSTRSLGSFDPDDSTRAVGDFDPTAVAERFHAAHEQAYGYRVDEPVELVTLRATATVERGVEPPGYEGRGDPVLGSREAWFDGEPHETTVYDRRGLAPGETVSGPAVLEQRESTTVIPPTWQGTVRQDGALLLETADRDGDDSAAGREGGR